MPQSIEAMITTEGSRPGIDPGTSSEHANHDTNGDNLLKIWKRNLQASIVRLRPNTINCVSSNMEFSSRGGHLFLLKYFTEIKI